VRLRAAARLVPHCIVLLRRLATDRRVSRARRLLLLALVPYLASPIDLIPDFIPVLGYLDDVVLVALALRSVIRSAGPEVLDEHWPGTPEDLALLRRVLRLEA
jgi:uncharacterized membrane protein YkvA (DUF1232 family)